MINDIPRPQIDEELFLVLRTIWHYERSLAQKYGLDYQQIYALQYLRRNPSARVTEISTELGLPMFTTSRMVDRLTMKGYVKKDPDTKDRRNLHIFLEPKGEEILQSIEDNSFQKIAESAVALDPEEFSQFHGLAIKLHTLLGVTEQVIK